VIHLGRSENREVFEEEQSIDRTLMAFVFLIFAVIGYALTRLLPF